MISFNVTKYKYSKINRIKYNIKFNILFFKRQVKAFTDRDINETLFYSIEFFFLSAYELGDFWKIRRQANTFILIHIQTKNFRLAIIKDKLIELCCRFSRSIFSKVRQQYALRSYRILYAIERISRWSAVIPAALPLSHALHCHH